MKRLAIVLVLLAGCQATPLDEPVRAEEQELDNGSGGKPPEWWQCRNECVGDYDWGNLMCKLKSACSLWAPDSCWETNFKCEQAVGQQYQSCMGGCNDEWL